MEIEKIEKRIAFFEKPVMVSYDSNSSHDVRAKTEYIDFIVRVSEVALMEMMRYDVDMFHEMLISALPPQYKKAKLEVIEIPSDRGLPLKTYGIKILKYEGSCHTPREVKKWIYCPSCGSQLKNQKCEYCGLEL
jgi:hypothetical protein